MNLEEEEGGFETNSNRCDDIDKIESNDSFKVLVESKPYSQRLAQASISAPCTNVVDKDGFTTVYSNNQKNALRKQFKYKASQPRFNQKEYYLLNQIQFDTSKHLHGKPKREI